MSTEQEYDAPPQNIDTRTYEQRSYPEVEPERYQDHYAAQSIQQQQPTQNTQTTTKIPTPDSGQQLHSAAQYPPMEQMFDPYDPMLDADPFGLSASMHFPTNYSFDQTQQR